MDVHPSGQGVEQPGPGPVGEALAQLAGHLEVIDAQQGVVGPQVADVGGAVQDPDQLMDDIAEGQPLGGNGGEASAEVEAHLVAEHAEGVDLRARRGEDGPRRLAHAVIAHMAQQVEILFHFTRPVFGSISRFSRSSAWT